jgi:ribonuclease R
MEKSTIEGIINISSKAVGYVAHPDFAEDVEIQTADLNKALNGDTVRVQLKAEVEGQRQAGEVTHIISRAREQFVGTVSKEDNLCIVKPDNHRIHVRFTLKSDDAEKVSTDQKVLVKMTDWEDETQNPHAVLLKIFGQKGEHEVEIQSIIYDKGFITDYPDAVNREAEALKEKWSKIPEEEIAKRMDLREKDIFTIDPADAKDFDDALHIEKLENENYEVGVHIADVSHFVTPGSELDKEAFERSFSVYLVDRTIPMLPEILSNELCSLNPNEETLSFSAIFEIDENAQIISRKFGKSVIHSKKRFSYEEAQAVIDAGSGPYVEELNQLNKIAKILEKQNSAQGSINFESDEIKFELDENGHPIRIVKKEHLETHKLVEEFMLLANREVAKFIYDENKKKGNNEIGLMYRTHDVPNAEKIQQLSLFLKAMGYHLPIDDEGIVTAKDLNALFAQVEGKAEESLVKTAAIRTMSKAIYSTENTGHFGLAFQYYTHFTSPIRRYPDLLVHRVLQKFLSGENISREDQSRLQEAAERASQREISAAEAERESIKYKQAEYMADHVGEIYEGVISGVSGWGIYVVLNDTLSEGMVHISKLGDDYFSLDEKKYAIIGDRTGKKFALGDPIKVKVDKIDLDRNNVDFSLVK